MKNNNNSPVIQNIVCPTPLPHNQKIVIGHGSGGKMTHDLVRDLFLSKFGKMNAADLNDAAILQKPGENFAFTTDCHVVHPLFFPGGDIGRLAVCGTVNDLAMVGATPLYITSGFILEEGFELQLLDKVIQSMQTAAQEAGISIVAGDTKVVEKNKADGLYITTAGFGILDSENAFRGSSACPGDKVLVSGSMGDHGIAVLAAREDLGFEIKVRSDVAPLNSLVKAMKHVSDDIHVLRDPTRGGLATTLNEIALQSDVCIRIERNLIPVKPEVASICEVLGFDPLYIANEGKLIAIVPDSDSEKILEAMKSHPYGRHAAVIGEVTESPRKRVLLKTTLGTTQTLNMLSGELLPRIC